MNALISELEEVRRSGSVEGITKILTKLKRIRRREIRSCTVYPAEKIDLLGVSTMSILKEAVASVSIDHGNVRTISE